MSEISKTAYAELFTRYREASMLADKYELIAKTHQNVNEFLRKSNDDLRRILRDEDEKSDALNEQNYELRELVRHMLSCIVHVETSGETVNYHCDTCKLDNDTGNCDFRRRARELGVEVGE